MGAWLMVEGAEEIIAEKTNRIRFRSGLWVLGPKNPGDVANLNDIEDMVPDLWECELLPTTLLAEDMPLTDDGF